MDILYGQAACSHCRTVERYLMSLPAASQRQITVKDIGRDQAALAELMATGHRGTPLLVTDYRGKVEAYLGAPDIIQVLRRRFGGQ